VLVLNDLVVRPKVEVGEHGSAVAFAEERLDVGRIVGHIVAEGLSSASKLC
jgi:hypothetical protein